MQDTEILKDLVDEKIVKILKALAKSPDKAFYLTELTNITGVNVSSTFRVIKKLIESGFVKSKVIGRTRYYKINDNIETQKMLKMIGIAETSSGEPLNEFVENIKKVGRIDRVILKTKMDRSAKIILIGDFIPIERITKLIEGIKTKFNFDISFVEFSNRQFERLYGFNDTMQSGQVIYRAKKEE